MAEIKEMLELLADWQLLLWAIGFFSFFPGVVLYLGVALFYPKEHPRRAEHIAELKAVKRVQRPFWVAEVICGIVYEGLPIRCRQGREVSAAITFRLMLFYYERRGKRQARITKNNIRTIIRWDEKQNLLQRRAEEAGRPYSPKPPPRMRRIK